MLCVQRKRRNNELLLLLLLFMGSNTSRSMLATTSVVAVVDSLILPAWCRGAKRESDVAHRCCQRSNALIRSNSVYGLYHCAERRRISSPVIILHWYCSCCTNENLYSGDCLEGRERSKMGVALAPTIASLSAA